VVAGAISIRTKLQRSVSTSRQSSEMRSTTSPRRPGSSELASSPKCSSPFTTSRPETALLPSGPDADGQIDAIEGADKEGRGGSSPAPFASVQQDSKECVATESPTPHLNLQKTVGAAQGMHEQLSSIGKKSKEGGQHLCHNILGQEPSKRRRKVSWQQPEESKRSGVLECSPRSPTSLATSASKSLEDEGCKDKSSDAAAEIERLTALLERGESGETDRMRAACSIQDQVRQMTYRAAGTESPTATKIGLSEGRANERAGEMGTVTGKIQEETEGECDAKDARELGAGDSDSGDDFFREDSADSVLSEDEDDKSGEEAVPLQHGRRMAAMIAEQNIRAGSLQSEHCRNRTRRR
jgi:hypothetical protein